MIMWGFCNTLVILQTWLTGLAPLSFISKDWKETADIEASNLFSVSVMR